MRWAHLSLIKNKLFMIRKDSLINSFNSQILLLFQIQIQRIFQEAILMRNLKNFRMKIKTKKYCLDQELVKEVEMNYNFYKLNKKLIQN